jgi:4-amino-4-deoxy-L-arabinose transferase-like glycosyltransferase
MSLKQRGPIVGTYLDNRDQAAMAYDETGGGPLGVISARTLGRIALVSILLLAALLRLYRLDENGFGTSYYSAGVRSMLQSWHNLFFNAFDPAGFVSLDKPPVALWIQVASAKLFGFSGVSLLAPQAIEGTLSVALIYHLVQRRFGPAAGLLAALFLALTPVAVAIDRSNDTDSCLVLVLLLAAWAASLAAERGSIGLLLLAMAVAGLGFNVKMLAASVAVPSLVALYWFGASVAWRRRLAHLALAGLVLAGTSLAWCVAYDTTPTEARPFVDSTRDNSMLELALGHNGVQRFVRGARRGSQRVAASGDIAGTTADPAVARPRSQLPNGPARIVDTVPVGPLRLADPHLAGQFAWLVPLALIGAAVAAARGGRKQLPLAPDRQALLLWSVWTLTYGIVFSFAGGIFHAYYLVTMAPPLAALGGIGLVALWRCHREPGRRHFLLPLALIVTALWQAYIEYGYLGADWRAWLYLLLCGGTLIAAGLLAMRGRGFAFAGSALALGLVALLATPTAWALSTVLARGNVQAPAASLALLSPDDQPNALRRLRGRVSQPAETARLLAFLKANHGDETYLLATQNARQAAPIIIETGDKVMALGGFMGTDPIMDPEKLDGLVTAGKLRFVLIGGLDVFGRRPPAAQQQALNDWVRAHGKPVEPALWRAPAAAEPEAGRRRGAGDLAAAELFDLKPGPDTALPAG